MKNILCICTLLLLSGACIKDSARCKHPTLITSKEHLVDISRIQAISDLSRYLDIYPQLQVYHIDDNEYFIGYDCNMYYKDLIILNERYSVTKGRMYYRSVHSSGLIPFNISISLVPSVPIEDAIETAMKRMDFRNDCVAYRLGIIDRNRLLGINTKDYRLAWHIEGNNEGLPRMVVDAINGQIIMEEDGR